uniref:N-acetyltransferase domain-containing protein n=1 Tax=Tetradesmus obliquus TaxID=3088 RepID=A0A383VZM8_TETOB|eukprot:jgi/Sobl393_1/4761/SZX70333.1
MDAAAVLLSSSQEAQLVALQQQLDFGVIPGTLQMLQAIPQSSLPTMMAAFRILHEAGTAAMHSAGHSHYLKLMLLAARPKAQGNGLGSAVLDAAVAAADGKRLPLYLEAANEELVPMYERYGFKPVGRLDLMTLMVRERL